MRSTLIQQRNAIRPQPPPSGCRQRSRRRNGVRGMDLRPTEPWVPKTFSVWVTKKKTSEWVEDRAIGKRRRRPLDCWDVGGRADGIQWLKRFPKAGLAQAWTEQLE